MTEVITNKTLIGHEITYIKIIDREGLRKREGKSKVTKGRRRAEENYQRERARAREHPNAEIL